MEPKLPVADASQAAAPSTWAESLSAAPKQALTINYPRRTLTVHQVTTSELDTVASLGNSVNLALAGISAGTFTSFAITLATVPIGNPTMAAMFAGVTFASAVASLFFGARAVIDYRESSRKLKELKRGEA